MTGKLILLAGLPGCGKTTYLSRLCAEGWMVFDDFKSHAIDHDPAFWKSRKFRTLITALEDGLRCAVADVSFCRSHYREQADAVLSKELPLITPEWQFFANNYALSEERIRSRYRPSLEMDRSVLRELTEVYQIPESGKIVG